MRKPVRDGDCYRKAGSFVLDCGRDGDVKLVHGNVASLPQDGPVNHAWVEQGPMVLDLSVGKPRVFVDRLMYYERYKARPVAKYTVLEAAQLLLKYKHWGPWD